MFVILLSAYQSKCVMKLNSWLLNVSVLNVQNLKNHKSDYSESHIVAITTPQE